MIDTPDRYNEGMKALAKAKTQNFTELVKIVGFDPKKHFRFANLAGADFASCDLRGYDFTGARLWGADFTDALITGARFDQAEIGYAPPLPHDFFEQNAEMPWLFWQKRGEMLRQNDCDLTKAKDYGNYEGLWESLTDSGSFAMGEAALGEMSINVALPSTHHLPIGGVFQDAPFAPEMVMIPAGTLMMGSPETEIDHRDNETLHQVTLSQSFAMARYPVTFAQWNFAQQADDWQQITGLESRQPDDKGWGRERPVMNVTYYDARGYAKWLSVRTGANYSLPTEAEWEYTARGSSQTPFWHGNTLSTEQANYNGNYPYNKGDKGEYRGKTLPVDSFEANPFGLYQVHGNIWEWCEDRFGDYDKGSQIDPKGAKSGSFRVMRGGSWNLGAGNLRSAGRGHGSPGIRFYDIGFRLTRQPS